MKNRRPHYQPGEGRLVIMGTRFCTHVAFWPGPPLTPWTPSAGCSEKWTNVIVSFAPSGPDSPLGSSCQKLSDLSGSLCLSYGGKWEVKVGDPFPVQAQCAHQCVCFIFFSNSDLYSSYLAGGSAALPTALHSWLAGGFSLSTVTLCNLGFT